MPTVYLIHGSLAHASYEEAVDAAINHMTGKTAWVVEVKGGNSFVNAYYLGWVIANDNVLHEFVNEIGAIPRAKIEIKVKVTPMFTGVLANE